MKNIGNGFDYAVGMPGKALDIFLLPLGFYLWFDIYDNKTHICTYFGNMVFKYV